jgi:ABC-type nitrate/sulfonate/bicarbonate transport system ATPase subunit
MSMSSAAPGPLRVEVREKRFPAVAGAPPKLAIRGLRFAAAPNEFVALIGPSGCGKTTALNIVAGLDDDFDGRLELPAGTRIGYVFQQPRLLPWRTVEENLRLVLDDGAARSGIVEGLLAAVGLADARAVFPTRLSLGMARRVALARAFAVRPTLLLMDEPFVSLDEPTARLLRGLLLDLLADHPATVLFVTHNLREAVMLADRIVVLAPAPTRVLAEVPVGLTREQRRDEAAVDRARAELLARGGGGTGLGALR